MFAFFRRAPAARLACRPRFIHTTRTRCASSTAFPPGVDAAKLAALQSSPLFKKIKENPAALEAVAKFAEVMQKNGVDTTAGPPSMLQMSKMFLNADVRAAAKGLSDAFSTAGIDLKDKDVMQQLGELAKLGGVAPPKS